MSERFDSAAKYLREQWGLTLTKNDPKNAHGYINGSWKSGYSISGMWPGRGSSWRRFNTLKEIEVLIKNMKDF